MKKTLALLVLLAGAALPTGNILTVLHTQSAEGVRVLVMDQSPETNAYHVYIDYRGLDNEAHWMDAGLQHRYDPTGYTVIDFPTGPIAWVERIHATAIKVTGHTTIAWPDNYRNIH